MAAIPGYADLLQCPYEKSHQIQGHAMSKHLFKCRKNYPKQKLSACPFNETHLVPEPELKIHVKQCPDRINFELYKYNITSSAPGVPLPTDPPVPDLVYNNEPVHSPSKLTKKSAHERKQKREVDEGPSLRKDDESWDDENVPAYDPQKYCADTNVIRKATLKKPAEKKAFYESERLRLASMKLSD